jgi:hypothetical protein
MDAAKSAEEGFQLLAKHPVHPQILPETHVFHLIRDQMMVSVSPAFLCTVSLGQERNQLLF